MTDSCIDKAAERSLLISFHWLYSSMHKLKPNVMIPRHQTEYLTY